MTRVTYYFTPVSGFAWVGHRAFLDLAAKAGAEVIFRPFDILALFAAQGTVPPPKQGDLRLSYRREDMARWAARRGVALNPVPAHWPAPSAPSCKVILAAGALGHGMGDVAEALMRGIWAEEKDIADRADLSAILDGAGYPADEILARAETAEIETTLRENGAAAQADGVFGSPTYVVGGTRFFGQDRLDFVAEALA
ncbi:MAG: 2-hydroxychromene-2-carboxylate isomerase [Roseicyclus sp.]